MEATNGDSEKTMQSAQRHRHTDKVSSPFPELIGKGLRESWKMMALFLIISMVEGIAFITTTAPLTMADPDMHLPSTYALATGQSFNITRAPEYHRQYDPRTSEVPSSMPVGGRQLLTGEARYLQGSVNGAKNALVESINPFDLTRNDEYATQCDRLNNLAEGERIITTPTRSNQYMFFAYIPQAIGMKFGFLTHANPSTCINYARASNLVCYLLLFLLAIAVIPTAKGIIALLGMLPLPVFCSSTLMTDGTLFAAVALFIAVCVRLMQRERRLNNWQVAALTVGTCLICFLKYVYIPIILLPWLACKALSGKQKVWYTASTVLVVGATVLCWQKFFGYNPERVEGLYAYNFNAALHNPFGTTFRILANVFLTTFNMVQSNPTLIVCLILLLIAWMFGQDARIAVPRRTTMQVYTLVGFIVFATLFLMYIPFLLTWTLPSESLRLDGLQVRYYYPILPLLVIPFIYRYKTGTKDLVTVHQ